MPDTHEPNCAEQARYCASKCYCNGEVLSVKGELCPQDPNASARGGEQTDGFCSSRTRGCYVGIDSTLCSRQCCMQLLKRHCTHMGQVGKWFQPQFVRLKYAQEHSFKTGPGSCTFGQLREVTLHLAISIKCQPGFRSRGRAISMPGLQVLKGLGAPSPV